MDAVEILSGQVFETNHTKWNEFELGYWQHMQLHSALFGLAGPQIVQREDVPAAMDVAKSFKDIKDAYAADWKRLGITGTYMLYSGFKDMESQQSGWPCPLSYYLEMAVEQLSASAADAVVDTQEGGATKLNIGNQKVEVDGDCDFKVGDQVQDTDGQVGKIIESDEFCTAFKVQFRNGEAKWIDNDAGNSLVRLPEATTTPNEEVKGEKDKSRSQSLGLDASAFLMVSFFGAGRI